MPNIPNRIYAQYRNSPKAVKWYNIIAQLANEMSVDIDQVKNTYDIDTANSMQLDVIGNIVGVSRSYTSQIDYVGESFGGLTGTTITSQFGSTQFTGAGYIIQQNTSDLIYKILIQAKIAKNNGDATIESILDSLVSITGGSDTEVIDHENMSFSVNFNFQLNPLQIFILSTFTDDVIQRPQGVRFIGFIDTVSITSFGDGQFGDTLSQFGIGFV